MLGKDSELSNQVMCMNVLSNNSELFFMCAVGGEKGSADTARDPRGFAIKFYTEEGNWDLTGNNTPIFFIRDPMLVSCILPDRKSSHSISVRELFIQCTSL